MTATYYPDEPYTITTGGLDFLAPNDDSIISVDIGFELTVGEITTSVIYLSNNGYIMFEGADTSSPRLTDGTNTRNYVPVDMTRLVRPMFAGLWYDIDTRSSGTTRYGTLTIDGRAAFRAVWTNVGAYDRQPYYSTFAMTIFDAGADDYHFESHVSVNDAYQWTEATQYPSPTVTIGLAFGVEGLTSSFSAVGTVDGQWRGRANTNPGLYVFTGEGALEGWGVLLS